MFQSSCDPDETCFPTSCVCVCVCVGGGGGGGGSVCTLMHCYCF